MIEDKSGSRPRFPALPPVLDDYQRAIYDRVQAGPRGVVRGPVALWLYSPQVAEHAQALGEYLRFKSVFPAEISEMIILMVARHFKCEYEWTAHVAMARSVGVSLAVIEAIKDGRSPSFTDDTHDLVFKFVHQLLRDNDVEERVFQDYRKHFGERGVVEATSIIGYYAMIAYLLNAVRIPAPGEIRVYNGADQDGGPSEP